MTSQPLHAAQTTDPSLCPQQERCLLALHLAASRGDTRAWEGHFGHLVELQTAQNQTQDLNAAQMSAALGTAARTLLGLWLQNRPQTPADAPHTPSTFTAPQPPPERRAELQCARLVALATADDQPIGALAGRFGLDALEICLLTLTWLIQTDPELARACAYAVEEDPQDAAQTSLLMGMILGARGPLWALTRLRLHPMAPLRHFELLTTDNPERCTDGALRLSESAALAMDGCLVPAPELVGAARWLPPTDQHPPHDPHTAQSLTHQLHTRGKVTRPILVGPAESSRTTLVHAAASAQGRSTLALDGRHLEGQTPRALRRLISVAMREARLHNAVLYIDLPDPQSTEDGAHTALPLSGLIQNLNQHHDRCVLGVHPDQAPSLVGLKGRSPLMVPGLTRTERVTLWQYALEQEGLGTVSPETLERVASRFPLPHQTIIEGAAEVARGLHTHTQEGLDRALEEVAARISVGRSSSLAERLETSLGWGDVVLPDQTFEALMEIITFARYRAQVMDQWGFRRKLPYGRALSALFYGPPGTGKTMVAGIIARELNQELLRVDVSQIVSKWLGETEKNIARLFEEARRNNAVLLFDEADSLFGKRTEVKSSNDRHANMNVNYLLQAMESFEGVVLMTTNFEGSIDEAFKRRIRFHIGFEFPDETLRGHLWRSLLPRQAPKAQHIDFDALGETFEMSGGYIKDAVLRAAFMAAEQGRPIDTEMLMEAGHRIYKELGHLIRW